MFLQNKISNWNFWVQEYGHLELFIAEILIADTQVVIGGLLLLHQGLALPQHKCWGHFGDCYYNSK